MSNIAHPALNSSLLMEGDDEEGKKGKKEEKLLFFLFFFFALMLLLGKLSWDRIKTLHLLIPSHHGRSVTTRSQKSRPG